MWAHAEGAPELLTGDELDTLEPRDLEYRCSSLPVLHGMPQSKTTVFSVSSCLGLSQLPAIPDFHSN